MTFPEQLEETATRVEVRLTELLDDRALRAAPPRLAEAMRHAVLGGGKRFRPFLLIESARLFGVDLANALNAAAAVEFLHCYSLVHDDLPAMDNDELRRGHPTVWKAFDEATAILVGDALLSLAFEVLARPETHADPEVRSELVLGLAQASGAVGMAGGQQLDIEAEKPELQTSACGVCRADDPGNENRCTNPLRRGCRRDTGPRASTCPSGARSFRCGAGHRVPACG